MGNINATGRAKMWLDGYEKPERELSDHTDDELRERGEVLAARYLSSRGMTLTDHHVGVADLVAKDVDDTVVLVAVRTRLVGEGGTDAMPELVVSKEDQQRYRELAESYVVGRWGIRFDVVSLNIIDEHNAALRHLVGVVALDEASDARAFVSAYVDDVRSRWDRMDACDVPDGPDLFRWVTFDVLARWDDVEDAASCAYEEATGRDAGVADVIAWLISVVEEELSEQGE